MRRFALGTLLLILTCTLWWAGITAQETNDPAKPEEEVQPAQQAQPTQSTQLGEQTTAEAPPAPQPPENQCVTCHREVTPRIVTDWELSKHHQNDVTCDNCHGSLHTARDDTAQAQPALSEKCAECHMHRVQQFNKGKHSLAWTSMNAVPTLHWQPMAQIEGLKGCGGCHRIGMKTEGQVRRLISKESGGGVSSCDTCHTRHIFSTDEARSPQACQTCHMGMDHPQWEMYSASKHGVRFLLKQSRVLSEEAAAPTCQTCHMPEGNHGVRTAWGYLGVRLPMPEDPKWAADRTTVLQGLGVLDPTGKPTARMDVFKSVDVCRTTQEGWAGQREAMLEVCIQCHAGSFAKSELEKGDRMVQEGDHLMAEAIRTVAQMYGDGILKKPDSYPYPYPDLLAFHDAPTAIEQKLFIMFLDYRMKTFKGAFHANPDYSFWYGWSAMQRSLTEIKEKAAEMKEAALRAQKEAAAGEKAGHPPARTPKKKR